MQLSQSLILVPVPEAHEPFGIMAAKDHVLEAVHELVLNRQHQRSRLNECVDAADVQF